MDSIERITQEASTYFSQAHASHRWDHTLRVYRLSHQIGEKEGANLEILLPAALLHDIARAREDASKGGLCHAREGARMAGEMLRGLQWQERSVEAVVHCIAAHRFRNEVTPQTLEARVLFDADKLDSIGAVGIGRAFLFAGETGARLHNKDINPEDAAAYGLEDTAYREYLVKLSRVKDRMMTPTGKDMALERHQFMEKFFERLNHEYDGWV